MRIVDTIHAKVKYYLVFDGMEIVGKFEDKQMATEWVKQQIEQNKQSQDA